MNSNLPPFFIRISSTSSTAWLLTEGFLFCPVTGVLFDIWKQRTISDFFYLIKVNISRSWSFTKSTYTYIKAWYISLTYTRCKKTVMRCTDSSIHMRENENELHASGYRRQKTALTKVQKTLKLKSQLRLLLPCLLLTNVPFNCLVASS